MNNLYVMKSVDLMMVTHGVTSLYMYPGVGSLCADIRSLCPDIHSLHDPDDCQHHR